MHVCPAQNPGPAPHVGGPVAAGSSDVFIGGMPAARQGDSCTCSGPSDSIAAGSGTVMINGMAAARMGDSTSHGGSIILGDFTVMIGG